MDLPEIVLIPFNQRLITSIDKCHKKGGGLRGASHNGKTQWAVLLTLQNSSNFTCVFDISSVKVDHGFLVNSSHMYGWSTGN